MRWDVEMFQKLFLVAQKSNAKEVEENLMFGSAEQQQVGEPGVVMRDSQV